MENQFKFFMRRIEVLSDGSENPSEEYDILSMFPSIAYKSITGINTYGKPKTYTESFPESSKISVFTTPQREQTDIQLSLYFFGEENATEEEKFNEADRQYHEFVNLISGCLVTYRDNYRNRKVKMYLSDATEVKTDTLYNEPYKEILFKFKNVYGYSFSLDNPIF